MNGAASCPIAIIGLGCLFPKAADAGQFWSNILGRVDAITDVPPTHWRTEDYYDADPKKPDHTYARRGGFLSTVDFPALEFGITPNTLDGIDTTQLLGLMAAKQALEDAGYGSGKTFDRGKVSVILGVTGTQELVIPLGARLGHPIWRRALKEAGVADHVADDVVARIADGYVGWQEDSFPGLLGNVVAGRIANRLDLGGTNCVVDAACASSLSAVHLAMCELASGRADMALTGGMDAFNDIFMYMCFSKTPALSPSGDARPFDAGGDGTILGEGLGCLVLKRLADAERDGDKIYAVIKSIGTSSDGKGHAIYAPSPAGQARALRQAYELAGVTPDTIELVEAHGTGTKAGDAAEVQALSDVYRAASPDGPWCALGSIKSQIGHTKAAAGSAGLIKAALALHHKVLPPTIKVRQPIEALASDKSPFYVNTEARPWLPNSRSSRRAAVSSFGFGGSNFHCVLEEYRPEKAAIDWDPNVQILAFSAATESDLLAAVETFPASASWDVVRAEAAHGRAAFRSGDAFRLLVVHERGQCDPSQVLGRVRGLLKSFAGKAAWGTPDGIYFGKGAPAGKLALIFSGQGSQYTGMFRDLACRFPQMQHALAEADALFASDGAGERLSDRIFPVPAFREEDAVRNEAALRQTDIAQPALGAVAIGALRVLEYFGVRPNVVAGHSYGELAALCAGQRFDFATLCRLSRLRGQLMAGDGGDRGAMLAVQAPLDVVESLLREERLPLVVANKNAPKQFVLSGASADIRRAAEACAARTLTAKQLPVSGAFHSSLVAGLRAPFEKALAGVAFASAETPVFSNTTAGPYPADPPQARSLLAGQMANPVAFDDEIRNIHRAGVRTFLEVGPGAKLTSLIGAILEGNDCTAMAVDASAGQRGGMVDLARALAQLGAAGERVELRRWDPIIERDAAAAKKPAMTVPLCGANYVKPRTSRPTVVVPPPASETAAEPRNGHVHGAAGTRPTGGRAADPSESAAPFVRIDAGASETRPTKPASAPTPGANVVHDSRVFEQATRITQENLLALQKLGEQTARLHGQFLENQNRSLEALRSLFEHQRTLVHGANGASPPPPAIQPPPLAHAPAPSRNGSESAQSLRSQPAPRFEEEAQPAPTVPAAPPASVQTPMAAPDRIGAILVEIVSEKTGYPAELLGLDMELDADLGIDSIKRVEIFMLLQEKLPGAPAIKSEHVGGLRTLRDVAGFLGGSATLAEPAASPVVAVPQTSRVLLDIVSEKTGYPAELLGLDMELDADLGIDSIKRVEIFMLVQEKLPAAPAIKSEHVGGLRTLRDVVAFLDQTPAVVPPTAMHKPVSAASASVPHADDFEGERRSVSSTWKPPEATSEATSGLRLDARQESFDSDRAPQMGRPSSPLNRYVLERVELNGVSRQPLTLQGNSEIWVADDGTGLAAALVAQLDTLGRRACLVGWNGLGSRPRPSALAGLIIIAPTNADDAFLRASFQLLHRVAPALRQSGKNGGSVFVTVSRLDGSFGLGARTGQINGLSGGLAGLAKTAAHEWPEVYCKALDLDAEFADLATAAQSIAKETLASGPREVGIASSGRSGMHLTEAPLNAPKSLPIGKGDVVVISGGARGVTAEAAVALGHATGCTLLLLGRSPEPPPEPDWLAPLKAEAEIKRALVAHADGALAPREAAAKYQRIRVDREMRQSFERIRATGADLLYRSTDVRDAAAVRSLLADVRASVGPIKGLVHGAGVLADCLIEDKTLEQFDSVYSTKVQGLRSLLAATEKDDLKVLALFSSSTGRFGRSGQVAYAVANEVLNKLAQEQARRRPGCRVVALNWGPWDGGMVTPALKNLFAGEGVGVIPLEAGGQHCVAEIAANGPVEVVVLGAPTPHAEGAARAASFDLPTANGAIASPLTVAFEREVSVEQLPILQSHVLAGHGVVPLALMVEWLAHAAMHGSPGLAFHGFDDVRVMKGIRVLESQSATVQARAGKAVKHDDFYHVPVELHSVGPKGGDVLHSRGTIVLASRIPAAPASAPDLPLPAYPRAASEIYQDLLFHGPDLQGIERVEGCSEHGIRAVVAAAPAPAAWVRHPLRNTWLAEPLVLDCGFQLMILWSFEQHGCGSLPTSAGRYRQYRRSFPREGVRVRAELKRHGPHRAVADLWFLDKAGAVVAKMEDYECVIDASLNPAFRSNQLQSAGSWPTPMALEPATEGR